MKEGIPMFKGKSVVPPKMNVRGTFNTGFVSGLGMAVAMLVVDIARDGISSIGEGLSGLGKKKKRRDPDDEDDD
jgi:hypothetical protein